MGCRAQRVVHTRQTRPHQVSRALAAQKRAAQQDAQLAARLAGALIAVSGSSNVRPRKNGDPVCGGRVGGGGGVGYWVII